MQVPAAATAMDKNTEERRGRERSAVIFGKASRREVRGEKAKKAKTQDGW